MVYTLGLLVLHPLYFLGCWKLTGAWTSREGRDGLIQESSMLNPARTFEFKLELRYSHQFFFNFNCHPIISGCCEG